MCCGSGSCWPPRRRSRTRRSRPAWASRSTRSASVGGRFAAGRLKGLADLPRSGRPRVFSPVVAAEVKAIACSLPAERGLPISAWTCAEIAQEAVERDVVGSLSASTVRRILDDDVIKPWQCRSWIFPRDPGFGPKAGRVLDLYARRWKGRRLGDDEYVISADEKSQLQAYDACIRTCRPGPVSLAGKNSSISAAGPWPTSPPWTCTSGRSSAGAPRRPGSNRSASSSRRS